MAIIASKPMLMIETPRAGIFGHRFLVGDISRLDRISPASFFSRAGLAPDGPDYLSISRQVQQELPGGAIRSGPETILVTGIRCDRISREEQATIRQWLKTRLFEIEKIIATLPDNRSAGSSTVLAAPDLAAWEEEALRIIPPQALKKPYRILPALAGFIIGVAAAVAALWLLGE